MSLASKAATAVRRAAETAGTTVRQARERHEDRWGSDDQYQTILLTALGALLSTLMPPTVAAAVAAGIGVSGLLDEPKHAAAREHRPRYGSRYDNEQGDRPYGVPLWDRFSEED